MKVSNQGCPQICPKLKYYSKDTPIAASVVVPKYVPTDAFKAILMSASKSIPKADQKDVMKASSKAPPKDTTTAVPKVAPKDTPR